MRHSLTTSLLLFTVLLIGLSCRDKVDIQPTPLPPINLATCRIVKATYKTIYISGPKTDYERLTIAGKSYDTYFWLENQYSYSKNGQIQVEKVRTWGGLSTKTFTYTSSRLFTKWESAGNDGKVVQTVLDTIPLNVNGYDDRFEYDQKGHLLFQKGQLQIGKVEYENNNRVFESSDFQGGTLTILREYDNTRTALPRIYQFKGVISQNLLTRYTYVNKDIDIYGDGPLFGISYLYEYDAYGRVKREIQLDQQYPNSGWPYGTNPGGIGITDYEYECP